MRRRDRQEEPIRRPPGFTEYGSDLLGLERVKLMSLAERGLLATMRWHIWSNDTLPADPKLMARLLGLEVDEVHAALTERVLSFFQPAKGDPTRLVCPELRAQMDRLVHRREKMLAGTLKSHIARKKNANQTMGTLDGPQLGTHGGSGVASELNRTEPKGTALAKGAIEEKQENGVPPDDPFLVGLERGERLHG